MIVYLYVSLTIGIITAIYSALTSATSNLRDTITSGIMMAVGWPLFTLTYSITKLRNKIRKGN